jgi:hypothetical protein
MRRAAQLARGLFVCGVLRDPLGVPVLHHVPLVQDDGATGDPAGLGQVVGHDHHGDLQGERAAAGAARDRPDPLRSKEYRVTVPTPPPRVPRLRRKCPPRWARWARWPG